MLIERKTGAEGENDVKEYWRERRKSIFVLIFHPPSIHPTNLLVFLSPSPVATGSTPVF